MRTWFLCSLLLLGRFCSAAEPLRVRDVVVPDHPVVAKVALLEGSVRVDLEIAADGKVLTAKSSGGDKILLRAAENNVRRWSFVVPSEVKDFPLKHTMTYVYKIQGKRVVNPECPTVVLHLPDRIEIIAQPPILYPGSGKKKPSSQ